MKLVWLTDIHLNFLDKTGRLEFYQAVINTRSDAILITGDIAEAPSLATMLQEMSQQIKKPIYFVLGNHDYYKSEISVVHKAMENLTQKEAWLHWLPYVGPQVLNKDVMVVGQNGWADGRLGDYQNSRVALNDNRLIADLFQAKLLGKNHLLEKMQQLADKEALLLKNQLEQAIKCQPKKIIILTHVPPFKESAWYAGKISDDNFLPYFTCKVIGDVLIKIANENTEILFLTLCGHTHGKAFYQPLENLMVKTGQAKYYHPELQEIITF